MISIDGVAKSYGSQVVVDDVSLQIQPGGITSIIGANGAGKSTLLSMVSRLLPMDAGRITVDGHDVRRTRSSTLAKRMSILRQDNHITVRLTVRELVTFGRFPHSGGHPTVEDERHVDQAIGYLGLDDLAHRHLDELSGGQRQRAFVAMVLAQDTDYVLLDEPLNNLDMHHSAAMMNLLRRAADELGRTVVIVLHDINFASCYSDRIIAMRDGAVVAQGPPRQIMTTRCLREVFDMDIRIEQVEGQLLGIYHLPATADLARGADRPLTDPGDLTALRR